MGSALLQMWLALRNLEPDGGCALIFLYCFVSPAEKRLEAKFLSNAPCGHYKFKFPKAVREDQGVGGRVFFFKALLLTGYLSLDSRTRPHVWVSKDELGDYLTPKYLAQVQRFILDF